ncbi:hypothetical protein Droror1_Dr00025579 [Drosera rotundifolia]
MGRRGERDEVTSVPEVVNPTPLTSVPLDEPTSLGNGFPPLTPVDPVLIPADKESESEQEDLGIVGAEPYAKDRLQSEDIELSSLYACSMPTTSVLEIFVKFRVPDDISFNLLGPD